jgi:quercetin dioxygenase-like cupin family protein
MAIPTVLLSDFNPMILSPRQRSRVIRIKLGLNIGELSRIASEVALRHEFHSKKFGHSGIGLQYRDPANPYYDAVPKCPRDIGLQMENMNEIGARFQRIFDLFPNIRLVRGRLLQMDPGGALPSHSDEANGWRLHIPVVTNPSARLTIDEQSYHLAAEGDGFFIHVGSPHSVENEGTESRTHLVFIIIPTRMTSEDRARDIVRPLTWPPALRQRYLEACRQVITNQGRRCQACQEKRFSLQVHWIRGEDQLHTGIWNEEDAVTLCERCHLMEHGVHAQHGPLVEATAFEQWLARARRFS